MPPTFTRNDKEQILHAELGPPGQILWLDDLPDRFEAQDQPEDSPGSTTRQNLSSS